MCMCSICFFFFQAEDGIRDIGVTGVQTCALPISAPDAAALARHLLTTLTEPVLIGGRSIRPSASIGVATSDSVPSAKDLVRAADAAMYGAKKAGKGRVEVFREHHHAAEMDRQQLRADRKSVV